MFKKFVFSMLIASLLFAFPLYANVYAATMEVVASGLNNPRGLAFGADGRLYVVEAGVGGEGPCAPSPEGGSQCYGPSAAVTRVDLATGAQSQFATGLPSLAEGGFFAIGAHDIAFVGQKAFIVTGLGADPAVRAGLGSAGMQFGRLVQMNHKGSWKFVADVSGFEASHNPDGGEVDSNPYAIQVASGKQLIVDAGGNSLIELRGKKKFSTLAVFPDRETEFPPGSGQMMPMQAVPTTVAVGPDGAFYVGQLTGFPFPVGGARVYRTVPGSEPEVFAEGFTNIIDIAFGPDGRLYVLEMFANGLLSVDPNDPATLMGALIRVEMDGSHTIVADEGLVAPGGLVIGSDGSIYVSNYSVFPGMGQVVKITP